MQNRIFSKLYNNIKSHSSPRRLFRLLRNIWIDLQFGGFLGGGLDSPFKHLGANNTSNSDYTVLPFIFCDQIKEDDVLVDIGCGKGRVLNWWLSNYPNNRIIGIEINEVIANRVRTRLKKYPKIQIISGSAIDNLPEDANILYLFNPFTGKMLTDFRDKIIASGGQSSLGKRIKIFFYAQSLPSIFSEDKRFTITQIIIPKRFHKVFLIEVRE